MKDSELLRHYGIHPKHSFGQNFLFDTRILDSIVEAAEVKAGDQVVEIGPGTGSLTRRLLRRGCSVTAFEIDRRLCRLLRETLGSEADFSLIEGDVLEKKSRLHTDLVQLLEKHAENNTAVKVVSNLPYGSATPLLLLLLELLDAIETIVVTVQQEVADRFCAPPGTQAYGTISILAQAKAETKVVKKLKRTVFLPAPDVDSAVLRFLPHSAGRIPSSVYKNLKGVVSFSFSQRRKKLRKRLLDRWPELDLEELITESARPQDIPPARFIALARRLAE